MDPFLRSSVFINELSKVLEIPRGDFDLGQNLIDLGLDSTTAFRLISGCKEHGIELNFHDIYGGVSIGSLASNLAPSYFNIPLSGGSLAPPRIDMKLVRADSGYESGVEDRREQIPAASNSKAFPMTDMQVTFLSQSLRVPGSNVITYREDHLAEDIPALKAAWGSVIASEEIFRARFDLKTREVRFVTDPEWSLSWHETIFTDRIAYEKRLQQPLEDICDVNAPVNCFRVLTLSNGGSQKHSSVLWHVHHALVDGYSGNLIIKKVHQVLAGNELLPGARFGPILEHLKKIQHIQTSQAVEFWTKETSAFESAVDGLNLPAPAVDVPPGVCHRRTMRLNSPTVGSINARHTTRTSPAAVYHAAWALTMARCVDSCMVRFGSVISGRTIPVPGILDAIGPTINTLPLNLQVSGEFSSAEFLSYVSSRLQEVTAFSWSIPEHGFSRKLFSVINVDLTNDSYVKSPLRPTGRPTSSATLDIPLVITIHGDGLTTFEFDEREIEEESVRMLGDIFFRAIIHLTEGADYINKLLDNIVSEVMREDLLTLGNAHSLTTRVEETRKSVVDLFRTAVCEHGHFVAVEKGSEKLTYKNLDSQSDKVADRLCELTSVGDVVCVDADRSITWIIAIYGVLKAGAIYCPIDPSLPQHLKEDIVKTSQAKIFLRSDGKTQGVKWDLSCPMIDTKELLREVYPQERIVHEQRPVNETHTKPRGAYLCFTSGSSGKPKGVLCSHEAVVAFLRPLHIRMKARGGWRIAQFLSPAFDASVYEIFSTLSYGATLVLWQSGESFSHLSQVDAAMLTPSIARVLDPGEFPNLKLVVIGGEAVSQSICDTWASKKEVCHMYGPTEATFVATCTQLLPQRRVTLGPPVPSMRIYLLDSKGRLLPRGAIGEICLAGIQVAMGYVGDTGPAALRFTQDHILPELPERMYKTGDRGYWDSSGNLCILGRMDRQIKLRGFRVDLTDIEARIQKAAPACAAVAVALEANSLICFIQPASVNSDDVLSKVRSYIPGYAMPKKVHAVDKFPLTRHGKLDYSALLRCVSLSEQQAPNKELSSMELTIARTWREVLTVHGGVEITSDSNFLGLGGSSVSQVMLYNRLSSTLKRDVPLQYIIDNPTLKELATRIQNQCAVHFTTQVTRTPESPGSELSTLEKYWWKVYQKGGETSAFTIPFACCLGPGICIDALERAWNTVLAHEPILRRRYMHDCHGGIRRLESAEPPRAWRTETIDLEAELGFIFDLHKQHPIRVLISETRMLVQMSHIVGDLMSLRNILRHVECILKDEKVSVPPTNTLLRSDDDVTSRAKRKKFWKDYLCGAPRPRRHLQSGRTAYQGTSHIVKLSGATYQNLQHLLANCSATFFQSLLTAISLALTAGEDKMDIVLGTPYLNRFSTEELDAVGLFAQPLPIRIQHEFKAQGSNVPVSSLLRKVRGSSLAALEHALPWDGILQAADETSQAEMDALFDVVVSYHEDSLGCHLHEPYTKPLLVWTPGAKFKLMIEFTVVSEACILARFEYDPSRFTPDSVHFLIASLPVAVQAIQSEMPWPEFVATTRQLQRQNASYTEAKRGRSLFGTCIEDIKAMPS